MNNNLTNDIEHDAWSMPTVYVAPGKSAEVDPAPTVGAVESRGPRRINTKVKVSRRELFNMTSQLAIMTQSGVDVTSALMSMARQCKKPGLKDTLLTIHSELINGRKLSDALRLYPRVFNETYIASIGAGEASGKMTDVFARLSQLQRNDIRLRSSIQKVLIYPVVLTTVSLIVLVGLVLFVLPQFAGVFEDFETPLPFITQLLIEISNTIRSNILLCSLLGLTIIGSLVALKITGFGKPFWDRFLLFTPLVRDVTRSLYFGRVCRLLGLMLSSGLPLLESLGLAKRSINNEIYRQLFSDLETDVLNGGGVAQRLLASEIVPQSAAEMVATGEQTGSLQTVTQLVGEHYEEDGESKLRDVVTLLEPAITIVMGGLVAVVVMAVLLPMFDLATFASK